MKAILISDSHGAVNYLKIVLERHKDIKTIFFMGDGADDLEELSYLLTDRKVYAVSGNNDISSTLPYSIVKDFNGKKIYMCHGHLEKVHINLMGLKIAARQEKADIALYGHTHIPYSEHDRGLYIFNPGALTIEEYAILDVENDEVKIEFKKIY